MKPVCLQRHLLHFATHELQGVPAGTSACPTGPLTVKLTSLAEFLRQQGLDILNTNDAWYWVLGHIDSGSYHFNNAVKNIASRGLTR